MPGSPSPVVAEAASNFAGHSLIDALGSVVIANTPLQMVEQTVKMLGVTDKPFLRASVGGAAAVAIGAAIPSRHGVRAQAALAWPG